MDNKKLILEDDSGDIIHEKNDNAIVKKKYIGCLKHPGCLWSTPCNCDNCSKYNNFIIKSNEYCR